MTCRLMPYPGRRDGTDRRPYDRCPNRESDPLPRYSPQDQTVYVDDITTGFDETGMAKDAFGNSMIGMNAF
jgi:hypothetical protein